MTKLRPYLLLLAAVAIAFLLGRGCDREQSGNPEQLPKTSHLKDELQTDVRIESAKRAKAEKLAAERLTQLEALRRELATETGKRKQAEQKAAQSYAEYLKNKNLHTCTVALEDCREENDTKAYSLSVQERMIAEADSLDIVRVNEIARLGTELDTCFAKRGRVNALAVDLEKNSATWEKKAKRRGKVIGFGAAIIAAVIGGVVVSK